MAGIEIHDSVEGVEKEWEELAHRVGAAPFLHPAWLRAWWKAFGKGRLQVLAVREGSDLTGILPLVRQPNRLTVPANWHTPFIGPVAAGKDDVEALGTEAVRRAGSHLKLRFIDSRDPLIDAAGAAASRVRWSSTQRVMQSSPYVPIAGTFDEFRSGLSRNRRKSLGRRERRLADLGELTLDVSDGTEGLDNLLAEGFALEASGWKAERGTAITSRPETLAFYEEISKWAVEQGWLRLGFLRLDGRAIAFNLSLEDRRAHYALKPGHDEELAKYGPGSLLAYKLVEHAYDAGVESVELLGDPDELKDSLSGGHRRERIELQTFSRSPRGIATRWVQTRGRSAARRIVARAPGGR
jgi:CelD/BcsL family acetyltransferase involved in cellulose biosynthesis